MAAGSAEKLYTPDLLSLATELAHYPYNGNWSHQTEVRSRTCGSTIRLGISQNSASEIERVGLSVSACAVGQASAAIFARHASGAGCEDVSRALAQLSEWLTAESASEPDWPDIALLSAARPHSGRHEAVLLSWKAAKLVLCKG